MDKFMHDHCLRFVFLLFHFSPRNYLDSNYRKFSTDEHNKHLVYVTCLQRLTKGVQLRCNPTLFNGVYTGPQKWYLLTFFEEKAVCHWSNINCLMLTSWSISPITHSTNNEDPSPPLVNTYRSSLKTQDQHNMSNIHKYQIRKRLINYTSLSTFQEKNI